MRGEQPGPTASQQPSRGSLAAREPGAPVRARLALYWLALYRRRRMLLGLALGMVAFETLIIVITRTIPPQDMFAGSIRQPPSAFRAFSGSSGVVSLASYPGLVGAGLVHPFWIAMQLTVVGSFGAAAVAADVEAGTIELLMVRPISRARLLAERTAALVTGSVLVTVAAIAAVAVGVAATPRLHEAVSLAGVAAAGGARPGAGAVYRRSGAGGLGGRPPPRPGGWRHHRARRGRLAVNFVAQAWSTVAFLRFLSPSTTTRQRTRWSAAPSQSAPWRCCWPSS
jgi:ABC-2 type transport system permease protein